MSNIELRVISPEEELFRGESQMVVIPGEEGDFAAMSQHSPLVTFLRPGKIEVYNNSNQVIASYFSGSGFVKVDQNSCIIMTDYVKKLEELDLKSIDSEIKKLQEEITAEVDSSIKEKLIEKSNILLAERDVAKTS